ncbi:diglucosylglycerate octanoyltransferase [Gordonia sp. (in: high G+C Gram-positive bacteria)]|uniref:diglucosylglycerate octanoyltransferase n=1 Tax=Gordonia sp. (in: high G+C Gram-positive bacteria) TaxID=84139 RepID=UPI0016A498A0|nr:diglucosylglycerate octanoyltransferase [Gordonia sp. (in: high G+C Gram-positive bacteria)]NLG46730.1 SGNH/GDSL hydrolase family protein [Gordonia sp. (in: high G+C Gram-positive bacteria)]
MGSIMVLGDSLSFYDETGGLAADDKRIWPNIVGAELGLDVELFARIGWTSRDIWWAITQDPRIWAAVPHADVLVLAFGGMDSLPSPLPTAFREQIRYVRPAKLREMVRGAYGWLQPRLSPIGWPMALPAAETARYFEKIRAALAHLRPDLPIVVCLPSTHDSPYYGHAHPGRIATTVAIAEWAAEKGLPTIDWYPTTAEAFADPDVVMNPDGIHWSVQTQRRIGELSVPVVRQALDARPESVSEARPATV